MNIISIHLRSSYKPDSAPSPHPHTHPHPVRTTSQQCGQEAKKQRCWVSSAGSMLYCLIINCNFMLNYPSHEGRFPISSASLSWSGHSVCKPAGCSTHQNAHDAQVHWAECICWWRLKDAGMWASLSKVPTKGSCEDPAFTASAEAPWTGMAKGTWTANPKVHCDTAPLLWLPGELIQAMQLPQHFSFQKYKTVCFSSIICHIISDIKHID